MTHAIDLHSVSMFVTHRDTQKWTDPRRYTQAQKGTRRHIQTHIDTDRAEGVVPRGGTGAFVDKRRRISCSFLPRFDTKRVK